MTQQTVQTDWAGKRLLSMMIIAGLSISGISFFMLGDGFTTSTMSNAELTMLCNNGLCYNPLTQTIPVGSFVQQEANINPDGTPIQNTESFTNLKLQKETVINYELSESKAVLFAAKDSFLRESIKDVNEGGNDILRVMGTGPTNNRALVAFDQNDLQEILADKTLASAKLRLFIVSNDGQWTNDQGLNLHRVDAAWDEGMAVNAPFGNFVGTQNGATWNCSSSAECVDWSGGKFVETLTDSVTITNDINGQWIEFDVTGDVQSFLVDAENNGWIVMKADEDSSGRINFAAREANDNKPQLELTFA